MADMRAVTDAQIEAIRNEVERQRVDLAAATDAETNLIRSELVRLVAQRARLIDRRAYSKHGNVHSNNSSAGAII